MVDLVDMKPHIVMYDDSSVNLNTSNVLSLEVVIPSIEELSTDIQISVNCPFMGCSKVLTTTAALKMHFSKVHSSALAVDPTLADLDKLGLDLCLELKRKLCEQIFFCPIESCNRNQLSGNYFTRKNAVKNHFKRQHMERKFQCECGSSFAFEHDLKKHVIKCGEKHCCTCGLAYNTRQAMLTHARRHGHYFYQHGSKEDDSVGVGLTEDSSLSLYSDNATLITFNAVDQNRDHLYTTVTDTKALPQSDNTHSQLLPSNILPSKHLTKPSTSVSVNNQQMTSQTTPAPMVQCCLPEETLLRILSQTDCMWMIGSTDSIPTSQKNGENSQMLLKLKNEEKKTLVDVSQYDCPVRVQQSPRKSVTPRQYLSIPRVTGPTNNNNIEPLVKAATRLGSPEAAKQSSCVSTASSTSETREQEAPVYFINFVETQTDASFVPPLQNVQATQTWPPETTTTVCKVDNQRGRKRGGISSNHCASIQTECSIDAKGRQNKLPIRRTKIKRTSSCQTNIEKQVEKRPNASVTTSTQTDIAKKRRKVQREVVAETAVQTSPPPPKQAMNNNRSIDIQTTTSSMNHSLCDVSALSLPSNEKYYMDSEAVASFATNSSIAMPEIGTNQSETQTLPFDLSDFFDMEENNSSSQECGRDTLSDTVSMSNTGCQLSSSREVLLDESYDFRSPHSHHTQVAAVETQTALGAYNALDSGNFSSPFFPTFTEGTTQTVSYPSSHSNNDILDWDCDYLGF